MTINVERIISGPASYRGLVFPDGVPVNTLKRKEVAARLSALGVNYHKDDSRDAMLTKYAKHLELLAVANDEAALGLLQAWDKTRGRVHPWKSGKGLECFA